MSNLKKSLHLLLGLPALLLIVGTAISNLWLMAAGFVLFVTLVWILDK